VIEEAFFFKSQIKKIMFEKGEKRNFLSTNPAALSPSQFSKKINITYTCIHLMEGVFRKKEI